MIFCINKFFNSELIYITKVENVSLFIGLFFEFVFIILVFIALTSPANTFDLLKLC